MSEAQWPDTLEDSWDLCKHLAGCDLSLQASLDWCAAGFSFVCDGSHIIDDNVGIKIPLSRLKCGWDKHINPRRLYALGTMIALAEPTTFWLHVEFIEQHQHTSSFLHQLWKGISMKLCPPPMFTHILQTVRQPSIISFVRIVIEACMANIDVNEMASLLDKYMSTPIAVCTQKEHNWLVRTCTNLRVSVILSDDTHAPTFQYSQGGAVATRTDHALILLAAAYCDRLDDEELPDPLNELYGRVRDLFNTPTTDTIQFIWKQWINTT